MKIPIFNTLYLNQYKKIIMESLHKQPNQAAKMNTSNEQMEDEDWMSDDNLEQKINSLKIDIIKRDDKMKDSDDDDGSSDEPATEVAKKPDVQKDVPKMKDINETK